MFAGIVTVDFLEKIAHIPVQIIARIRYVMLEMVLALIVQVGIMDKHVQFLVHYTVKTHAVPEMVHALHVKMGFMDTSA